MSFVAKGVLKNGAVVFLCAAAMYMAAYLPWSFNARFSLVIVLLLIAGLYFRWYLMFLRGGHAELDVLLLLQHLPKEYAVGSDLVLGKRGNIDVFVVGPAGIWAIEVKSHRTWIKKVSPFVKRCIGQAHAEAFALRDFLKEKVGKEFKVQPVVVFSHAAVRLGPRPIEGVFVVGQAWIKDLILQAPVSLNGDDMELVKNEIRKHLAIQ
jgi:hypothetical protein